MGKLAVEGNAITYAPMPEEACCTVLLGSSWPALTDANKVCQFLDGWQGAKENLADSFQQFLKSWASADSHQLWPPEKVEPLLKLSLDALAEASRKPEALKELEVVLSHLQACLACSPWKVDLVPNTLDCIGKKWFEVSRLYEPIAVPDREECWGTVRSVARFGLSRAGTPFRKASVATFIQAQK